MNFFKSLFWWFWADEEDRQRTLHSKKPVQKHHDAVEAIDRQEVDDFEDEMFFENEEFYE